MLLNTLRSTGWPQATGRISQFAGPTGLRSTSPDLTARVPRGPPHPSSLPSRPGSPHPHPSLTLYLLSLQTLPPPLANHGTLAKLFSLSETQFPT